MVNDVSDVWKNQLSSDHEYSISSRLDTNCYKEFIKKVQKNKERISQLPGIDQLLWEIGLLSPVCYLDEGPIQNIQNQTINELKSRLISYDFRLFIDDW